MGRRFKGVLELVRQAPKEAAAAAADVFTDESKRKMKQQRRGHAAASPAAASVSAGATTDTNGVGSCGAGTEDSDFEPPKKRGRVAGDAAVGSGDADAPNVTFEAPRNVDGAVNGKGGGKAVDGEGGRKRGGKGAGGRRAGKGAGGKGEAPGGKQRR